MNPLPQASRPRDTPARRERTRRCRCGQCRLCQENARWERIFTEKFADPNYYSDLTVRSTSPLSSF